MEKRNELEKYLLAYLAWYNDIDDSISLEPIREYFDNNVQNGYLCIERIFKSFYAADIPYDMQVELIKSLAKAIPLWNE